MIAPAGGPGRGARPDRSPLLLRRRRIVLAAEWLVRTSREGRLSTAELCDRLRVSPRALHNAFATACRDSPGHHLKSRRLDWAREALLAEGSQRSIVKAVALTHGFRHFGRFAEAYRHRFGELPSETASRCCPNAPADPAACPMASEERSLDDEERRAA